MKLRLYVSRHTGKSLAAISDLKKIYRDYLNGRFSLEVIDLTENPTLAKDHRIIATPTLVRTLPLSINKIIGDLSDTERVLVGLEIHKSEIGLSGKICESRLTFKVGLRVWNC